MRKLTQKQITAIQLKDRERKRLKRIEANMRIEEYKELEDHGDNVYCPQYHL